jgi:trimeric autotransporter adhesin
MKKLFTLSMVLLITLSVFAQAPQKMSYQVVIRNAANALVTNHAVGIQISILQGSPTGTSVYVETQNPTTNANGLATIEIGGGTPVTGIFAGIDWSAGPYYIKTETDPTGGTNYTIIGTSQILSVPYALYAKTASNGSLWLQSGSNMYFNSGNVGVGTNSPSYPFTVLKGNDIGIYGESTSSSASGIGIKGYASSSTSTGRTYGVMGESASYRGNGVYGYASSSTGSTIGVYGQSVSPSGFGVYGLVPSTTGNSYGVYGESVSSSGSGVQGYASSSAGVTNGVWGLSNSTSGIGVFGESASVTGTTFGVKGTVASSDGYSGYFTGGKFYIGGQVQIAGGSPAAGKVLTSDANGLASWEPTANDGNNHYVGEKYGGGVVIYAPYGIHGVITTNKDQSTSATWYNAQNIISDPANHDVEGKKYTDWRLPTLYESENYLYLNKDLVGGFASDDYWTSTENSNSSSPAGAAYEQSYIDGHINAPNKQSLCHVRAVRTF